MLKVHTPVYPSLRRRFFCHLCDAVRFAQAADADADPAIKEVENSKFSTSGLIVSNAVFVRCGPGEIITRP